MNDEYNQQLVRWTSTQLLIIQNFKRYTAGKVNENLVVYGIEALPSILYILTIGNRSDYKIDSVRVTPDFIENIIEGYDRDVVAFIYSHRLFTYDENGEETKKVALYYEDNLVRITNYHELYFEILTDTMAIHYKPNLSLYNEYHPAMINLSGLLSIN